jgi:hypothetical protein
VWSDGTALDYENWATDQPDDVGGEDCTHPRTGTGLWNDENCDTTIPFVCAGVHVL